MTGTGTVADVSPTAPGHEWRCSGCTFRTRDLDRACDHAMEARRVWPFDHILYERMNGDLNVQPRRRIVIRDGAVTPERKVGRGSAR